MIRLNSLNIQLENLKAILEDAAIRGNKDELKKIRLQIQEIELLISQRREMLNREDNSN